MMIELLFSPALWYGTAAGAAIFAALAAFGKKAPMLWGLLSCVCMTADVLLGLVQGRTLAEILPAVLAVTAVALAGLSRREKKK